MLDNYLIKTNKENNSSYVTGPFILLTFLW